MSDESIVNALMNMGLSEAQAWDTLNAVTEGYGTREEAEMIEDAEEAIRLENLEEEE